MNFRKLQGNECRLIVMRHGTNGEHRDSRPKDTICDESYEQAFKFGFKLRACGIKLDEVVMSPRGRAVKTAFACAEGNTNVGESIPPFQTDKRIRDGSHDRPDLVAVMKAYAKKANISEEQACLECLNPVVIDYAWKRTQEHAACCRALARYHVGQTILTCGHSPFLEMGILLLKNPWATFLVGRLRETVRYLQKGEAVELILSGTCEVLEENYLE